MQGANADMKTCRKCDFTGDDKNFYDRELVCKPCRIKKAKEYYHENKTYRLKYIKEWARRNPEKRYASIKRRKAKDPEKFKDYSARHRMKTRYGITLEDYKELFKNQNGLCAICSKPERTLSKDGTLKRLALDHCHTTKRVRKLLCDNCNKGLGAFYDKPELLRLAAEYLENCREVMAV